MGIHLFLTLGDANGLIAPYLVDIAAFDIVVDRLRGVVGVSGDLGTCILKVQGDAIGESVFEHVAPVHLYLPYRGAAVGGVGLGN